MKPKLLNDGEAKRFGAILGYAIAKAHGEKGWSVLDLRDCDPWVEDCYPTARDAAYDIAKWLIGRTGHHRGFVKFDENSYLYHFALHASCLKLIEEFKGKRLNIQAGDQEAERLYSFHVEGFYDIYQQACYDYGVEPE